MTMRLYSDGEEGIASVFNRPFEDALGQSGFAIDGSDFDGFAALDDLTTEIAARTTGDATTLASAHSYSDSHDATTLASANAHADAGDVTTLASAHSYSDSHDATTLASAHTYADTGDAATLASADAYGDAHFSPLGHVHAAADITSGVLVAARGGTTLATFVAAGALLISASASTLSALQPSTNGKFLQLVSGAPAWHTLASADVSDATDAATANVLVKRDANGSFSAGIITAALVGNVTGDVTGNVTGNVSGSAAAVTGATQSAITSAPNLATVGTIASGTWHGASIATTYTDAKIKTVTGTTNRLTIGGTATDPTFDLSTAYAGQDTIVTVGTIATGTWHGASIATAYTDAKLKTLTGVSNRTTIGGTSTDPTVDISSAYVGQASITTLGTIGAGVWQGTAVAAAYLGAHTHALTDVVGLLSGGKIDSTLLPAIAITETDVVASQAAMLALDAEKGDLAVRTDLNKTYILAGSDPAILANWQELLTPTDAVLSVAGKTGAVTLVAADITDLTSASTGITKVGTIATGVWHGTTIDGQYGGTGVNNAGKTLTLGGNVATSGAFALTLTLTADTTVTLPTSGTLVNSAVTSLPSLASVGGAFAIGGALTGVTSLAVSGAATFASTVVITGQLTAHASTLALGTDVTGTNTAAPDVTITTAKSTGNAVAAQFIFQVGHAHGSDAVSQTLENVLTLGDRAVTVLSSATLTLGSSSITTSGITATLFTGALSGNVTGNVAGNATTATTLATARTLWGQSFDGSAAITGSLTSVGDITGGASSMTITAGTGNSRTLTFKTTSSGGVATTAFTLGADQSATFAGTTTLSAALTYGGVTLSNAVTGTGNMVLSISPTFTGTITAAAGTFTGDISNTHAFISTGAIQSNAASRAVVDYNAAARFTAFGPDASTLGTLEFDIVKSDGSARTNVGGFSSAGTFNVGGTFTVTSAGGIVATTASFSGATFTISAANIGLTAGAIVMGQAASLLIPGATSFSVRNNGNSADNLLISDAGAVTLRGALSGVTKITGLSNVTAAGVFVADATATAAGGVQRAFSAQGTQTTAANGDFIIGFNASQTVSNAGAYTSVSVAGVYVSNPAGSGTVANAYGLYLETITRGTANYAIYTNSGQVRFGDAVTSVATGNTITASLAVTDMLTLKSSTNGTAYYLSCTLSDNTQVFGVRGDGIVIIQQNASVQGTMLEVKDTDTGVGTDNMVRFIRNGSVAGSITTTLALVTAYNTTSDERLKRDLGVVPGHVLDKLRVRYAERVLDGSRELTFFAQEAYAVTRYAVPSFITPGDEKLDKRGLPITPWQADYSKLVPELVLGWQDHERRLSQVEKHLA